MGCACDAQSISKPHSWVESATRDAPGFLDPASHFHLPVRLSRSMPGRLFPDLKPHMRRVLATFHFSAISQF